MRTAASLRSSFSSNKPRAILWIIVVVVAIALIVAVLVGFRPRDQKPKVNRRADVAEYIVRVGRIQTSMAAKIRTVDSAYKQFAKQPKSIAARVQQYRNAEHTLAVLRDQLRIAVAPPDARRLKRLLVQLANENVDVAKIVTDLASYLPALAAAQQPLTTAVLALRTDVKAAKTAHAQADAFDAYAAATTRIAKSVASLRAPSLFEAARDAESGQLRRLSSIAAGIADALRTKQVRTAQRLVADLAKEQSKSSVARAQRAAAIAYNARLSAISRTAKAIERERVRLERKVPSQ
jgi:hypothetical protein